MSAASALIPAYKGRRGASAICECGADGTEEEPAEEAARRATAGATPAVVCGPSGRLFVAAPIPPPPPPPPLPGRRIGLVTRDSLLWCAAALALLLALLLALRAVALLLLLSA